MKTKRIGTVKNINTTLAVPGSKSLTNRALPIAALADGHSEIQNALFSEDTEHMAKALNLIGAQVKKTCSSFHVQGLGGTFRSTNEILFTGNSGTTMRFLVPLLNLGKNTYHLDGSSRMRERPIRDLLLALEQIGGHTQCTLHDGFPPLLVKANGLKGGIAQLKGSVSSQFLTALLLSSPYARDDVVIEIKGTLVSRPYIDLTIRIMRDFGVDIHQKEHKYFVPAGQRYKPTTYKIEGDASSATYFFAAAAITGGRVRVTNLSSSSIQGDTGFVDLLEKMGCQIKRTSDWIEVTGCPLNGIEVDLNTMPDTVQTLAVTALFAKGKTSIRNVANLRFKETDRLLALETELRKLGAKVRAFDDGLEIEPTSRLCPAQISTYNDHRMAMSFAIAGLVLDGIIIEDPDCVAKSFPGFWEKLNGMY